MDHIQETVAEFKKCLTQRVYDGGFIADAGVNADVASDWLLQRLTSTRERAIREAIEVALRQIGSDGFPRDREAIAWDDACNRIASALTTLLTKEKEV